MGLLFFVVVFFSLFFFFFSFFFVSDFSFDSFFLFHEKVIIMQVEICSMEAKKND